MRVHRRIRANVISINIRSIVIVNTLSTIFIATVRGNFVRDANSLRVMIYIILTYDSFCPHKGCMHVRPRKGMSPYRKRTRRDGYLLGTKSIYRRRADPHLWRDRSLLVK